VKGERIKEKGKRLMVLDSNISYERNLKYDEI